MWLSIFHTFETLAFQRPPRSGQPQSCGRPPVTSSLSREELWFSSASSRGSKWSIGYQMMQPELSCWSPLCCWYAIIINLQWSLYEAGPAIFTLMVKWCYGRKWASKVDVENAVEIVPVLSVFIVIRDFITR